MMSNRHHSSVAMHDPLYEYEVPGNIYLQIPTITGVSIQYVTVCLFISDTVQRKKGYLLPV